MRVKIRIGPVPRNPEVSPGMFGYAGGSRRPATPFLMSVCAHAVVLALLPAIGNLLPGSGFRLPRGVYTVKPLKVLIPERIYYTRVESPAPGTRRGPASSRANKSKPASAIQAGRRSGENLPDGLELPRFPASPHTLHSILQPQAQPIPAALPPQAGKIIAWTPPPVIRRTREPDAAIVPGRIDNAPGADQRNAPPTLDIPNREPEAGDLNIARQATTSPASLPVPPAATTPVRVVRPSLPAAGAAGISEPLPGDPSNLILLLPSLPATGQILSIPRGASIAEAGGGQQAAPDGGSREGNAGSGSAGAGAASTRTAAATRQQSSPGNGGLAADAAPGTVPGSTGAGAATPAASAAQAAPPRRNVPPAAGVLHPVHGAHDVTVIQSSLGDALGQDWNVLSGKPVYTVYIQVGTRQPWTLHYCLPRSAEQSRAAREQAVVSLGGLERIDAPYPVQTVVPPALLQPRSKYILIHGFLAANGRFRDMKLVQKAEADPSLSQCLADFDQWVFRPAARDNVPVEVETLLAVPPDRTLGRRLPEALQPQTLWSRLQFLIPLLSFVRN